jgi:hypothetical protein
MSRGIIIPILEKYEMLLLANIDILRNSLHCKLPLELWQIGNEISEYMQEQLNILKDKFNITFKNAMDYTDNPEHWRGWQIKAFILKHTMFDEVVICDCDSVFLQNPEIIFNDKNYKSTGTFFFKDWLFHQPKNIDIEMKSRHDFIKLLMPEKKQYFPIEWNYIYGIPSKTMYMWYYQESGVVFINKLMHSDVVETIYKLNEDHEKTYKCIYGDKETYWIAFVMHDKQFYMNELPAYNYKIDTNLPFVVEEGSLPNCLAHYYGDNYFFSQKGYPIRVVNDHCVNP